jgi:hypothetical protein
MVPKAVAASSSRRVHTKCRLGSHRGMSYDVLMAALVCRSGRRSRKRRPCGQRRAGTRMTARRGQRRQTQTRRSCLSPASSAESPGRSAATLWCVQYQHPSRPGVLQMCPCAWVCCYRVSSITDLLLTCMSMGAGDQVSALLLRELRAEAQCEQEEWCPVCSVRCAHRRHLQCRH